MLLGLLLIAVELFTPGGFYLLFFGLAAVLVGGITAGALVDGLSTQVLLFTGSSVAGILIFRRALVARFGRLLTPRNGEALVGESALALADLAPGALGKVELRGTTWSARNSTGLLVPKGKHCTVERVEGLTLWVRMAAEEYLVDAGASDSLSPPAKEEVHQ